LRTSVAYLFYACRRLQDPRVRLVVWSGAYSLRDGTQVELAVLTPEFCVQ